MMTEASPVSRRRVEVTNPLGLHLRPADTFVKLAQSFRSEIWVECRAEGKRANGKSILDLATLAAACGTTLDIEARGSDAEEAATALIALIESHFFEDVGGGPAENPLTMHAE
jgi:phosphocarrier protein